MTGHVPINTDEGIAGLPQVDMYDLIGRAILYVVGNYTLAWLLQLITAPWRAAVVLSSLTLQQVMKQNMVALDATYGEAQGLVNAILRLNFVECGVYEHDRPLTSLHLGHAALWWRKNIFSTATREAWRW